MEKEDFIPGEWYTSSTFTATVAFRFLELTAVAIRGDEFIRLTDSAHLCSTVNYSFKSFSLDTFKRVPLEDVIEYLPYDHPQKNLVSATKKRDEFFS